MTIIGGVGSKEDNSLKITADTHSPMATWDSFHIDSPYKDKIQAISIECCAGDVAYVVISYLNENAEKDEDRLWTESYTIKNLKLSLESATRIFYADFVQKYNEKERNKVLGIDKEK